MNFKRARYDRPNYSDDSNTGNGIEFKDVPLSVRMTVDRGPDPDPLNSI